MSLATVAHRLILDNYLRVPPADFFASTYPGTETATRDKAGFLLVFVVLVIALEVLHRRAAPWTCLLTIGVLDTVAGLLVALVAVAPQWSRRASVKP